MIYACYHISKDVERDEHEKGCVGGRRCVLDERINVISDSLSGLFKELGARYGLDIDDLWIADDGDDITRVGFSRTENADGDAPSDLDLDRWKRGKLEMWLADYGFLIEARTVWQISRSEIAAAGIKTHD